MKIKIKKGVLENFYKRMHESRSDLDHNNTQATFYGDFGSVKSPSELEAEMIKPSPQMANQVSIDAPPVEDPYYIPGSQQELGRAAQVISAEVPNKKIEYFYRKLHSLLDEVIEESIDINEAIDYNAIDNLSHRKIIQDLVNQAVSFTTKSKDSDGKMTRDQAGLFVLQNRMLSKYPEVTFEDIVDEIEKLAMKEKSESEKSFSDSATSIAHDAFVNPPSNMKDLSPNQNISKSKTARKRKNVTPKAKSKVKSDKGEASEFAMDKRAEDEMMDMMASAYSEFTEMDDYAKTWDWSNYKEEAPYLKLLFDIIKILHQISYRLLQASYINKYGGYIYDPEAEGRGGKKGAFVLEKQGPTSRPEALAMIRRIYSDFGLTYENIMRQHNILKMDNAVLTETIERAMIGIFQRVPQLYSEFKSAVQADISQRDISGTAEEIENEMFGFLANVLAHKYQGESQILDRDLVNVAVSGIFKRCLLDLPAELGIATSASVSLDSLGKKRKQSTDKTYGFNLAGATKRFEKLRKDPKFVKQIKKLMPKLILGKITETKTAKVTKSGSSYNFEDKLTGLGYELTASELKSKILEYVNGRLEGKKLTFDEESAAVETALETDTYDPTEEEEAAKKRLDKESYETRRMVQEMEKMISSGDWMHIAPLFGFSGAPGVRSWYLRYPERKFNIMMAARGDKAPAGAKRYMEVFRKARENLGNTLITFDSKQPGALDLIISDYTDKKSGMSTSDQQMVALLEEMKENIEDLMNLYEEFETYQELEEKQPERVKELSNTPGGSLLRFGIGAVFDNIIRDIDTEWHAEMKEYLTTVNGLEEKSAHDLAYYFTGLKNKPSKGDFSEDKSKLTNAAQAFVNVGMEAPEFFTALRYSQGWLFSTLDRELKKVIENKIMQDNYFKTIYNLTSQDLYVRDPKKNTYKLNKKFYSLLKKMLTGKKGAISAYLDQLAIEQFQKETKEKVEKVKKEKPELFKEITNFVKVHL
jgi:hypothetical protein